MCSVFKKNTFPSPSFFLPGASSHEGRAVQFQRVQDLPRTWEALRPDRREGFPVSDGDFCHVPETEFRTVGTEIAVGVVRSCVGTENDAVFQKKDDVVSVPPDGFVRICVVQDDG